ncbi:MAG: hypothetical protein ACREQD_02935 [Candidatus Binataceae bacterium]
MKNETIWEASLPEPILPDDFARRVIAQARLEQHRQLIRRRVIAAAVVVVAVLPFARPWELLRINHRSGNLPFAQAEDNATPNAQFTETLGQATPPAQVSDYLMPDAAPVRSFAAAYSDAAWDYDPSWTSDR